MRTLEGRVALVTGAGDGLGRVEALTLAAAGAAVAVNDIDDRAHAVAEQIERLGGRAIPLVADVGDWVAAETLVSDTIGALGGLDILVNNAGITRDRMLFNLARSDWESVMAVHLTGHAATSRAAAAYWRTLAKTGDPVDARVINTASESFLFGPPGQANYAAAKAGIVALTLSTARALGQYGVTANAICPRARTAMTADLYGEEQHPTEAGRDPWAPEHVARLVRYLAGPAAAGITGQVLVTYGPRVAVLAAPTVAATFRADVAFDDDTLDAGLGDFLRTEFAGRGFAAPQVAHAFDEA
ncbi:3-oxoacyl-[acyl-carrier protein] reductase/hypothetical protein [Branchiibius hedensis]|uniref:3-oxoacyl-[acyl-carrier protein] reductase n=1 Tax=Branchiibius hedensis TaxID=672460 RepID=A0A2Y8ZTY6_9MICO|nr:SDR family NAD(P)-dependent oxidoreductase [Branchiibius hedensis]PWJ27059.1 3-oxoacyl-[acyl-carrier protein] reductase/hypothetical protein [Branchiibius hedensis]SSA35870.1 3-oxoacyl-[acyl-carrier protein] reductase [Branchiibius hedensis]